jgi:hypothetical protein
MFRSLSLDPLQANERRTPKGRAVPNSQNHYTRFLFSHATDLNLRDEIARALSEV